MGKTVDIGGRIHNPEVGNIVTGANEILDDTKNKKQDVINSEVDAALEALDAGKQDNLTFDQTPTEDSTNPVTSGGVYAADLALQQAIEAILALIPSAASALNQLADKSFVNSSIATASATFRGTYNLVSDLHLSVTASHQDIATALASVVSTADNNDYCFVQIPTSDTSSDIRVTERYKFNGTAWAYEYDLNNSGFTATQWEAINSGITALLVTKLGALPTAAELATSLAEKQNVLTFDNVPVSGSDNPVKSGGLYQLFTAIDAKFPSDASSSNKLVAEDRLAAYVTAIIEALDASFDLTSADGHVTFRMTQTNGVIASVQILTSDIASASQVSTNTADIAALQAAYAGLTQSDIIVVNGALPSSDQQQNKIYRQPDQDHTPPQFYSDYMWNGTTWVLMATYNNAVDQKPIINSQNIISSDGIGNALRNCGEFSLIDADFRQGVLLTNGNVSESSAYGTNRVSGFIPVKFGDVIRFVTANAPDPYADMFFYLSDKTPATGVPAKYITTGENEFVSPLNGFARFMTNTDINQSLDVYIRDGGSSPLNVKAEKDSIRGKYYVGAYIQGCLHTDGIVNTYHVEYKTTDFIHLNAGEGIEFRPLQLSAPYCVLGIYENNTEGSFIGYRNYTTEKARFIATEECYIRVSLYIELSTYIEFVSLSEDNSTSIWKNKKVGFCGDSTTLVVSGHGYVDNWQAKTGAVVTNYAVGGTAIADDGGTNPMCLRISQFASDLDLVVVLGGVNDFRGGVPLGNFEDLNADGSLNGTFYGALHTMVRGLKEKYPTKPIVFMTPFHNEYVNHDPSSPYYGDTGEYNYNQLQLGKIVPNKFPLDANWDIDEEIATGGTLTEYCEAIKEVCGFYGVPVIDLRSISGICPILSSNYNLYTIDGIHPYTAAGATRICDAIYPFLEKIYQ